MRKKLKIISLVFLPAMFSAIILFGFNKWLDCQINLRYNSALGRSYGVDEMNKGVKLLEHNAKKGDLIIIGSSELANADYIPQNASNMFPNNYLDSSVSLVGRAYVQDLLNTMKIGAVAKDFKDKKVVLIVSLQWFLDKEINKDGFKAHFSELQFYKTMNNKDIGKEDKKYICKRITELANGEESLVAPLVYCHLYSRDDIASKIGLGILKPYYFLRENFLSLKDKYVSYKAVQKFKDYPTESKKEIDWYKEEKIAENTGKSECTNNEFYVYDKYYDEYLKPNIGSRKDSFKDVDLINSNEMQDYGIFVKTCSKLGVKPYIIFMPTNGAYYDFTGLTKDKRNVFYDKLAQIANKHGLDYLDLREHEYEPYFLKDVMHLGWKGWLYIDKEITKYYSQNK